MACVLACHQDAARRRADGGAGVELREEPSPLRERVEARGAAEEDVSADRPREGPGLELARLLLAYNRHMVTSKLEWGESTATIRISVVLNTDSNFDRKAFRSQLLGVLSNARRIRPALIEAMKNNP